MSVKTCAVLKRFTKKMIGHWVSVRWVDTDEVSHGVLTEVTSWNTARFLDCSKSSAVIRPIDATWQIVKIGEFCRPPVDMTT